MYTWGYIKENTLSKLNLTESEANEQGFLYRFSYCANEAMSQICSAVRADDKFFELHIDHDNLYEPIRMPEGFIAFSDDIIRHRYDSNEAYLEVGDEYVEYYGHNKVICKEKGFYLIPYKARWFFFTKDLDDDMEIPAPADICEAIPFYIASQCLKVDDEARAAIYRNEFEIFLARLDDTSFKSQRTFHIGGGW